MDARSAGCHRKILAGFAVAAFAILLSACTGTVSGQVFIDKNGNGAIDSDEVGVPYAKLVVIRGGNVVAEKLTDGTGNFAVHLKQRTGQVCMRTDLSLAQNHLNFIQSSMGKAARVKALTAESGGTGTGTEPDGTTADTTQTSKPAPAEGWVGDQYCIIFKGNRVVNFPVKVDYDEALSQMPLTRLEVKCFVGRACVIKIPYPDGCQLESLYLPQELVPDPPVQAGLSFNTSLNSVGFGSQGEGASAQKAETAAAPSLSVSGFKVAVIELRVKDDATAGELSINPTADCGDLQKIPVTIVRDINVIVSQDTPTTTGLSPKQIVPVTVRVENIGKSPVVDGMLVFTAPEGAALTQPAGGDCTSETAGASKLGRCKLEIPAEDIKTLVFRLTMPDVPKGQTQELTCSAEFKVIGTDEQSFPASDVTLKVINP
ncbi:MAG: hypothetical protein WC956_07460 [bacterium]